MAYAVPRRITHTDPLDGYPDLLAQVAAGDPGYIKGSSPSTETVRTLLA